MKKLLLSLLVTLAICACAKKGTTTSGQEDVSVTKIYNLVILDRSGSMLPLRGSAVLGYNGLLDVVRSAQQDHQLEQQNLVTLTLFSDSILTIYDCDTIANIPDLLLDQYVPYGFTALLDAMGHSLTGLQERLDSLQNATAVVTILTDGWENASRNYTLENVQALVDTLKTQGVMFVYMGTNQEVELIATVLHIDNYLSFDSNPTSLQLALDSVMQASAHYYERMAQYNKDTKNMSKEERNEYLRTRNAQNNWFEQ